jgi:signal transduction histidine kinase
VGFAPAAAEGRVSILMADDEPKNLMALEAVLEGLGQNLVKASSGKEALRCLMREDFAVILLDVQMPEMDGFETAALIRSRDRSRFTPIIFLTAVGKTEREVFRGYEVGAVDYLLKPFAPEILRYKVGVLVELHQKTEQVKSLNAELQRRALGLEEANRKLQDENSVRRRAEEELRQLNQHLEQRVLERTRSLEQRGKELARSNQELAQFAAVASHDLQEPLRTMSTSLQLLEANNRGKLDGQDEENITAVLDSARRMRQLINDVLTFSQVGGEELTFEKVDCKSLVDKVLMQLKEMTAERGAEISVGALPELSVEPSLLGQVFQNLIANALKFCRESPPRVEIGAEEAAGEWRFWVKDNGIGIQPAHFDKLFKLFRRLHPRDEYPGSGLGLSICKKIIERHGGKIWLESTPGKGSTFYFSLPSSGNP